MADTLDSFRRATDEFGRRVHAVPSDGWTAATPCTDWDVRSLVNHVTGEMLWAPPIVAGQTVADVGDRFEGDVLGGNPPAAWDAAVADAIAAFSESGALERTVHLSFGDFSGDEYCWQLTSDALIHAWDLARGIGGDDGMPDDLATAVYEFMAPVLAQFAGSDYFGKQIDVPADAPVRDRLLGAAGRQP